MVTRQVDPHAENYYSQSPYSWVANNPVVNTDPTGMDVVYGGGQYGGDLYTGVDAQNLFSSLQNQSGSSNNGGGGEKKHSAVGIGKGSAFSAGLHGENPYEVEKRVSPHYQPYKDNQALLLSKIDDGYLKSALEFFFEYMVGPEPPMPGLSAISGPTNAGARLLTQGVKATKGLGNIKIPVYRVYGGASRINGYSWTPINPKLLPSGIYRKYAGLPNANWGTGYIKGSARLGDIMRYRRALPLDGNPGGLPELIINPNNVNMWKYMNRPGLYKSYWEF